MTSTEDLAWIVALVSPRDIAIHPNFASRETVSAPAGLAALTSSQLSDFARLQEGAQWQEVELTDPAGVAVVAQVRQAFSVGSVESGADELAIASRAHVQERPALATACAIIAAACYGEVDRLQDASVVLEETLTALRQHTDASAPLLRGALLVNLALREMDQGTQTSSARADEAAGALSSVDIDALPTFSLSLGVEWDSATSIAGVVELLLEACAHHSAVYAPTFEPRLDLVRKPAALLGQRSRSRIATGFQKYLQHEVGELLHLTGVTWSAEGTDGDSEIWEALLTAEFSGHPNAHSYRRLAGIHRFLLGMTMGEEWRLAEAVRLIRQSGDKKQLTSILNAIRNQGPLSVIRADALQILSSRRTGPLLREVELDVLRIAAPLLGEEASADGMRLLLSTRSYVPPQTPRHWQLSSIREGAIWRAVVELAKACGEGPFVAKALFAEIQAAEADDSMDMEFTRAVNLLPQSAWADEGLRDRVGTWCRSEDAADFHRQSRDALRHVLDIVDPAVSGEVDVSAEFNVSILQRLLDRSLVHDAIEFPTDRIDQAEAMLLSMMQGVREDAARGQYSMGGISECELAVAFALLTQRTSLWTQIADFLCDAHVQRGDKISAIERLVRSVDKLPILVGESLRGHAAELLDGGPDHIDQGSPDPFPHGLRLCAVLGLISSTEALIQVGRLLGDRRPKVRQAGVEVILDLLAASFAYPWLATSAMLLSQDRAAEVRAMAGRALTQLGSYGEVGEDAVTTRLIALLEEDGYLIPNSVLVGLLDSQKPLNDRLRRKVEALAATHLDATAKRHATKLVGGQVK